MATWLDLDAVAELLGVDRGTVYRWVRSGELRAIKTNSGWYVDREDTLRFKASQ